MANSEFTDIQICQDCLMASANGLNDPYSEFTEEFRVRYIHAKQANYYEEPIPSSDDEGHFSWSSCEFCGDKLGGMRYTAQIAV